MKCLLSSLAQNSSRQRSIIVCSKQQQHKLQLLLATNTNTIIASPPYSRCYCYHVNTHQSVSLLTERKRTCTGTTGLNAVFNSRSHYNNLNSVSSYFTKQFSSSSPTSNSKHDTKTTILSKNNQNGQEHMKQNCDDNDDDDSNTIITNPISELSSSDLKLAMETIQIKEQSTQSTLSSSPSSSININSIPGTSKGKRQLAIIYTCSICNTRSAKKFTERAYNHGVVLVRCPKCENLHLIADRLGYFTDKDNDGGDNQKKGWDIEMFLKKINKQDNIKVMTHSSNSDNGEGDDDDVLEVTVEDVVGETFMNEIKKGER
jgi:hypothetical protein